MFVFKHEKYIINMKINKFKESRGYVSYIYLLYRHFEILNQK